MQDTRVTIKDKVKELMSLYQFEDYKEAEYIACRLIAKQSIEHIKNRLAIKIEQTSKLLSSAQNPITREQLSLGLKRRLNIARFLGEDLIKAEESES